MAKTGKTKRKYVRKNAVNKNVVNVNENAQSADNGDSHPDPGELSFEDTKTVIVKYEMDIEPDDCPVAETVDASQYDSSLDIKPFDLEVQQQQFAPEENGFTCDSCGKTYKSKISLVRHSRQQHTKKHRCKLCGKKYILLTTLRIHKARCKGNTKYPCKVCGKTFANYTSLTLHENIHAGELQVLYNCDLCNKGFSTPEALAIHTHNETSGLRHVCDVCGKGFNVPTKLKRHSYVHTGERPYECTICSKGFGSVSNLNTHMIIHTNDRPYKCDICGKGFQNLAVLKKHFGVHTGVKPHVCTVCSKGFFNLSELVHHTNVDHSKKLSKCHLCSAEFSTNHDLKLHMAESHKDYHRLQCEICKKIMGTAVLLNEHRRVHAGGETFTCKLCERVFKSEKWYKLHQTFHDQPDTCKVCGKSVQKGNLERHIQSTHLTDQWKHPCAQCGRRFRRPSHLKVHYEKCPKRKAQLAEQDKVKEEQEL
ncbi:zinc finger protein 664-like [Sabethes cyaneus]|uniref:zinc finger protein 664-like n=1 Tax=Sabethes cyaneus TaxID=53552 RepID=UPI00237D7CDE|nr:zinc finger protein 664-like [Sabethes cyaneus]XP_053697544.1 zinc finger protein 664-like [Sabethes cyaneus]